MIKIHCTQLGEFIKIYVINRHVLPVLLVPVTFSALFPAFWFVICPYIWQRYPNLLQPRNWLIGYWLLACIVWFISLAICLAHMRNCHARDLVSCLPQNGQNGSLLRNEHKSDSTEDLWNEDRYIPDAYLPSPPEIRVGLENIQPNREDIEPKREMDETWDYDYDEQKLPGLHGTFPPKIMTLSRARGQLTFPPRNFRADAPCLPPSPHWKHGGKAPIPNAWKQSPKKLDVENGTDEDEFMRGPRRSLPTASPPRHWPKDRNSFQGGASAGRRLSGTMPTNLTPYYLREPRPRTGPPKFTSRRRLRGMTRFPAKGSRYKKDISKSAGYDVESDVSQDGEVASGETIKNLSEEEVQSMHQVCAGKIKRQDSLVADAKFDRLLASLQSLASEIEKDFDDHKMTAFAIERARR